MNGFSYETLAFLEDLNANNTRDWFQENRQSYAANVKNSATTFGDRLANLLQNATGKPVGYRIFRINRDLRFSKDKTPYNTHVHIAFSYAGDMPTRPAWMFGLEPGKLTVGAGIMTFSKTQLQSWRVLVAGEDGRRLAEQLQRLTTEGARVPEPELKRVPAAYPGDHPRAVLLRRKGLTVWRDCSEVELCFGHEGPSRCLPRLLRFRSVVDWLSKL